MNTGVQASSRPAVIIPDQNLFAGNGFSLSLLTDCAIELVRDAKCSGSGKFSAILTLSNRLFKLYERQVEFFQCVRVSQEQALALTGVVNPDEALLTEALAKQAVVKFGLDVEERRISVELCVLDQTLKTFFGAFTLDHFFKFVPGEVAVSVKVPVRVQ